MIVVGPMESCSNKSPSPTVLPANIVVERTARELERIALMMVELEDYLLALPNADQSTQTLASLQSIDMIQQSVNSLSTFLYSCSKKLSAFDIDVGSSISHIKLEGIRERLKGK